jgi:hypothetical protein
LSIFWWILWHVCKHGLGQFELNVHGWPYAFFWKKCILAVIGDHFQILNKRHPPGPPKNHSNRFWHVGRGEKGQNQSTWLHFHHLRWVIIV